MRSERRIPAILTWTIAVVITGSGSAQTLSEREFRLHVRDAIGKGRDYLVASLTRKRSRTKDQFERAYPLGYRALSCYALLEAGVEPDGEILTPIFEDMERRPLERTYSVALYAMALDARARARFAGWKSEDGREAREATRLQECVDWLIAAKWPERGTWGYERWQNEKRTKWEDYSNTQFAVLALAVGRHHGIEVPATLFEEVVTTFTDNGWPMGSTESLLVEGPGWTQDDSGRKSPAARTDDGILLRALPMGWAYRPGLGGSDTPPQFSMISAASSSLMVSRSALRADLDEERAWEIDHTIAGGLISLKKLWSTLHPSPVDSIHRNYYYTLYSLEKALDYGGIVLLGDTDWYREHALILVHDQSPSGAWGSAEQGLEYREVSTAFALLFLRRATRHLRVDQQGAIITGADGDTGIEEGRVFLPSVRGTVSIQEIFESLADLRTRDYVQLGREIAESISPERIVELLPHLVGVRNGSGDVADRFADATIVQITGLPAKCSDEVVKAWGVEFSSIRETAGEIAVAALMSKLGDSGTTDPLRLEVIRVLGRRRALEAV
ncbi:MAG: hypothetical protein KDC38_18195, partial [Planctomycetes bacterium]|nr:hypothetical protein [Planctomycetota bacterium]